MILSKVQSSDIVGSIKRAVIQVLGLGKHDVRTAAQAAPYGVDSRPIKDMIAVYAQTGVRGEDTIIGYWNKNCLAAPGEIRIFATDANGVEKTYIHLKNNEDILLGGDADNAVRYTPLDTEVKAFKDKVQAELGVISTAIGALGGTYVPGTLTIDISQAKADHIKTP